MSEQNGHLITVGNNKNQQCRQISYLKNNVVNIKLCDSEGDANTGDDCPECTSSPTSAPTSPYLPRQSITSIITSGDRVGVRNPALSKISVSNEEVAAIDHGSTTNMPPPLLRRAVSLEKRTDSDVISSVDPRKAKSVPVSPDVSVRGVTFSDGVTVNGGPVNEAHIQREASHNSMSAHDSFRASTFIKQNFDFLDEEDDDDISSRDGIIDDLHGPDKDVNEIIHTNSTIEQPTPGVSTYSNSQTDGQNTNHSNSNNEAIEDVNNDNDIKDTSVVRRQGKPKSADTRKVSQMVEGFENRASSEVSPRSSTSSANSSRDPSMSPVMRTKKIGSPRMRAESPSKSEEDEDDDEDAGIYAETHRRSTWLFMGDEGHEGQSESVDGAESLIDNISETGEDEEDAFDPEGLESQGSKYAKSHERKESTGTTYSEMEYRNQVQQRKRYQAVSRKVIKRMDSQPEMWQRDSMRFFEADRSITIQKGPNDKGFGFHIKGTCPTIISTVNKGGAAERSGVLVGDVLVTCNGINVTAASHREIQQQISGSESLEIEVTSSSVLQAEPDEVIMSGYLTKQSAGTFKLLRRRYFVLKQDHCIYYYKTDNFKDEDPLGAIPLLNYTITKATEINKKFAFKATKYGARTYVLIADNENDMNSWANAMNQAAVATKNKKNETWLDVSSHNVGLPALSIKNPECHGILFKMANRRKTYQKRYCVLKDACLYYYLGVNSTTAQGVAHLQGYKLEQLTVSKKRYLFALTPPEPKMRAFQFYTDHEFDYNRWATALTQSIGRWKKMED